MEAGPGRIQIDAMAGGSGASSLPGFAYNKEAHSSAGADGIRGNLAATPLNQAYFSAANYQINQNAIRRHVYEKSGQLIDPVGSDDLFMVMRALYLQYGRNLPTDIPEQIAELNARVVAWCAPRILSEMSMYKTYTDDITAMPVPLSHPVNISGAGTRSLPFKPFF